MFETSTVEAEVILSAGLVCANAHGRCAIVRPAPAFADPCSTPGGQLTIELGASGWVYSWRRSSAQIAGSERVDREDREREPNGARDEDGLTNLCGAQSHYEGSSPSTTTGKPPRGGAIRKEAMDVARSHAVPAAARQRQLDLGRCEAHDAQQANECLGVAQAGQLHFVPSAAEAADDDLERCLLVAAQMPSKVKPLIDELRMLSRG